MTTHLLYIHGFNSSPQSLKARQAKAYFAEHHPEIHFHCPQLLNRPDAAIEQLQQLIEQDVAAHWLLMGSSLGGYFSTFLAEHYELPAVLINPAVKPYLLLQDYFGEQENPYTGERFIIEHAFIEQLQQLERPILFDKNRYFVMVQTGDEVLDYQQAVEKFQGARLEVQQGGDHGFCEFDAMLPKVAEFFQLAR